MLLFVDKSNLLLKFLIIEHANSFQVQQQKHQVNAIVTDLMFSLLTLNKQFLT